MKTFSLSGADYHARLRNAARRTLLVAIIMVSAIMVVLNFTACDNGGGDDIKRVNQTDLTSLVTWPENDNVPDTTAIEKEQYRGSIAWYNAVSGDPAPARFEGLTSYKALVYLTPRGDWTFDGIAENAFTYTGAESVTNAANSGEVTIVFPPTSQYPALHGTVSITGTANVGQTLTADTTGITNADGSLHYQWNTIGEYNTQKVGKDESTYDVDISDITCQITVTVTADKNSGSLTSAPTVTVPSNNLSSYLSSLPENTEKKPYPLPLKISINNDLSNVNDQIKTAKRYVILDLSNSTAAYKTVTGSTVTTYSKPKAGDMNIIYDNEYIIGVKLPSDLTSIGQNAFYYCEYLKSIEIPSTVTVIDNSAFSVCTGLEEVALPLGLKSIGTTMGSVFSGCSSLKSIVIPDSVTYIGSSTFGLASDPTDAFAPKIACTSLESVTLPNSITTIQASTFEGCTELANIVIPQSVTSIASKAFKDCTSLEDITIPDSVTSIVCDALTTTKWYNDKSDGMVVYADKVALTYKGTMPSSINIVDGTKVIADYAFAYSTNNSTVNLTSITLPDTLVNIGNYAFAGLNASFQCGLTSIAIPSSVRTIGRNAFQYGKYTNIEIPEGVTTLGNEAFKYCTSLKIVTIPRTVVSIGGMGSSDTGSVFGYCSALETVNIAEGVTGIGKVAFEYANALTTITIPASITKINGQAFQRSAGLTTVTFAGSNAILGATNVFSGQESLLAVGGDPATKRMNAGTYNYSSGSQTWSKQEQ